MDPDREYNQRSEYLKTQIHKCIRLQAALLVFLTVRYVPFVLLKPMGFQLPPFFEDAPPKIWESAWAAGVLVTVKFGIDALETESRRMLKQFIGAHTSFGMLPLTAGILQWIHNMYNVDPLVPEPIAPYLFILVALYTHKITTYYAGKLLNHWTNMLVGSDSEVE